MVVSVMTPYKLVQLVGLAILGTGLIFIYEGMGGGGLVDSQPALNQGGPAAQYHHRRLASVAEPQMEPLNRAVGKKNTRAGLGPVVPGRKVGARPPKKGPPKGDGILFNFDHAKFSENFDINKVDPGRMWIPITIDKFDMDTILEDVKVKMCEVDYDSYQEKPWVLPMGGLLNQASGCTSDTSSRVATVRFGDLERLLQEDVVTPVPPTGFIFHETRCGSTLVANMLGAVPQNIMWSESTGPWKAMHTCAREHCQPGVVVRILRVFIALMGRSQRHSRLFFKFQSSEDIDYVTAAFPDTPWMFLFREPVEVMMSRLGAQRIGMEGMAASIAQKLDQGKGRKRPGANGKQGGREKGVASQLSTLCQKAIQAADNHPGKGLMVEYTHLPSVVSELVLPVHFEVELEPKEIKIMEATTAMYSKVASFGKKTDSKFEEDEKAKHEAASDIVKKVAAEMLYPEYNVLKAMQTWLSWGVLEKQQEPKPEE